MNTVKYLFSLLAFLASIFGAGSYLMFVKISQSWLGADHVAAFSFLVICGIFFFYRSEGYRKSVKWLPQEPDRRPIVRWWTHNGVNAVSIEEDYQFWWQVRERFRYLQGFVDLPTSHILEKPAPMFTMFFSNKALTPDSWRSEGKSVNPDDWRTGNNKDLTQLLYGCRVEKTELFIPQSSYQWLHCETRPVSLKAAWRLVHGPNAKPPAD